MAKAVLPTNYKDDIMASSMAGKRRYNLIQNSDGTVSLEDVTNYTQVGSNFGAAQINQTNTAVNNSADASKIINSLSDVAANTQSGMIAGALAVRELNSKTTALDNHRIKILSTISLLEDAKKIIDKNVPSMTVFHLGGDGYTSNDLPNEHYRYGSAVLVVRNKHSISLMLYPESNKYDVYLNTISTGNWQGWKALAYKDYVDSKLTDAGIGDDRWYSLTSEITYKKKNGIVFVRGDCRGTITIPKNAGEKILGTLPSAYRPGWLYYVPANPISMNDGYNLSVRVENNGNIVMVNFNPNSEISYWSFLLCYPV